MTLQNVSGFCSPSYLSEELKEMLFKDVPLNFKNVFNIFMQSSLIGCWFYLVG